MAILEAVAVGPTIPSQPRLRHGARQRGTAFRRFATVLTFLIVFLIQYTQNRDATAIQLKLDELLRAIDGARTSMVDLEAAPIRSSTN